MWKAKILLLVGVVILPIFFAGQAYAASYIDCEITVSCSYTEVLYMKNNSGGYWNAHVQLVTNGSYPYVLCCNSSVGTLSNSSCADVTVLKLSDTTNAHVQVGNYSGPYGVYSESVCLSETASAGDIECIYTSSACGSDYECLVSMAGMNSTYENLTNAQIGPCQEYEKNVCCRYYDAMDLSITKILSPDLVVVGENETVYVNITVRINETSSDIPIINVSDEVPYEFDPGSITSVKVYFIDYSPYSVTEITTNSTVNITISDKPGTDPTLVMVNITSMWQTDAGSNLTVNDAIRITYTMITHQMASNETKTMWTHAWIENNDTVTFDRKEPSSLRAAEIIVRGYKTLWVPDLSNPQNISGKIVLRSMGGTVNELEIADYLPDGATIWDLNVTYYNSTNNDMIKLVENSDYEINGPYDDTLPDGTPVDIYVYNFTIYDFDKWDGQLYDNDSIIIRYNVSVLGGGMWTLPTILGGYDPQYQKHIKTEMYGSVSVPSFDVSLETLTAKVEPGSVVRGLLRLINVGGPRAKVDVFVTYSAKTMGGDLIVERSETFAVVETKEKELVLTLPESMESGMYTFEAFVTYTGREALSTDIFEVIGIGTGAQVGVGGESNALYYILVAVMGIVIGVLLVVRRK